MPRIVVAGVIGLITSALFFGQSTPAQTRDRRLEEALTDSAPPATAAEVRPKVVPKPAAARWHNQLAWAQIQGHVARPGGRDSGQTYVGGCRAAVLTGNVKLTDDTVSAVSPPDF